MIRDLMNSWEGIKWYIFEDHVNTVVSAYFQGSLWYELSPDMEKIWRSVVIINLVITGGRRWGWNNILLFLKYLIHISKMVKNFLNKIGVSRQVFFLWNENYMRIKIFSILTRFNYKPISYTFSTLLHALPSCIF